MARCKTDRLSGLIRKSPLPCGVGFPTPRGEPLFFDMLRMVSLVEPFAKEGDNNFPLWQRGNKGDFVNCRSRINPALRGGTPSGVEPGIILNGVKISIPPSLFCLLDISFQF